MTGWHLFERSKKFSKFLYWRDNLESIHIIGDNNNARVSYTLQTIMRRINNLCTCFVGKQNHNAHVYQLTPE